MEHTQSTPSGLKRAVKWPKPIKIVKAVPFEITSLWNTGELRLNKFDVVSEQWDQNTALAPLLEPDIFVNVKVIDGAFAWDSPGIMIDGKSYVRDLDPGRCYKESILLKSFDPVNETAQFLKKERLNAKLTQAELAQRTGYSPKYISKIERGATDIQIGTLYYILEVGLGKYLKLTGIELTAAA
jgi:DNA-binding XRE family transcriptional regulator